MTDLIGGVCMIFAALVVIGYAQRIWHGLRDLWRHDWADPMDFHDGDGG